MPESLESVLARIGSALLTQDQAERAPAHNHREVSVFLRESDPVYVPASVLVGLVPRSDGLHVLLTKRTEQLRQHGGQISFPGGRMETLDANPFAAALRESYEEIALQADKVSLLGYLEPLITITGYRVFPVVALIEPDYQARPDGTEVAELFEAPLQLFLDQANEQPFEIEFRGKMRQLIGFDWQQHRIWGATASMLLNLRQRLQANP
jgi:8-oxo-dGTP pyrophosphatase MutT (NUDIX family)